MAFFRDIAKSQAQGYRMNDNSDNKIVSIKEKVESRKRKEDQDCIGLGGNCGSHPEKETDGTISPSFVRSCLYSNELGDGMLFAELYRGKFVYNKSSGEWMVWQGHHWEIDIFDKALIAVEGVADLYQKERKAVRNEINSLPDGDPQIGTLKQLEKDLGQRVYSLRGYKRRSACLLWAHTCQNSLSICGDYIDQKPYLLPVKNGVVNLKTGDCKDGNPLDYLLKASEIEWAGIDAPCPVWEKTIHEMFDSDDKLVRFFQIVIGMALIGVVLQAVLILLYGIGRNGKSLVTRFIMKVLGPLAGVVPSEMLLDQKTPKPSNAPSPEIMALKGERIIFASETDNGCRISPSKVKWFTGNDVLCARNPHDKYNTNFIPSHTLFLLSNYKPSAPPDDFAFWERILLIPFALSFVDREPTSPNERRADKDLPEKLKEEYPGILAWMVRGCLLYQLEGLTPPNSVTTATAEYQREEDSLADWLDECCFVDKDDMSIRTSASELMTSFEAWWEENISKRIPSKKWWGKLMTRRFEKVKNNSIFYLGIRLL